MIAVGPRNCFAWGEVGGIEVELAAFTLQKIGNLMGNPQWSARAAAILEDDLAVGGIMYYPEHRAGLRWLRRDLGIKRPMPDLCLHP